MRKHSPLASSSWYTFAPFQSLWHFIPKWLFDFLANSLWPFPLSSIPWASVIDAGMPDLFISDTANCAYSSIYDSRRDRCAWAFTSGQRTKSIKSRKGERVFMWVEVKKVMWNYACSKIRRELSKNWAVTPTKSKNEIVNKANHLCVKRRI